MTGRENSEDQFEKGWREAMDGANVPPPSSVWENIDHDLTFAELKVYKSKTIIYRWAVAAVVLIAASFGIWQYLYFQEQMKYALSQSIEVDKPDPQSNFAYRIDIPRNRQSQHSYSRLSGESDATGPSYSFSKNNESGVATNQALFTKVEDQNSAALMAMNDDTKEVAWDTWLVDNLKGLIDLEDHTEFAKPKKKPVYHYGATSKKEKEENKYFAGLRMGSGAFDPNYQSGGNSLLATNLNVNPAAFSLADNEAIDTSSPNVREGMQAGQTISMGLNFGMKLNDRWSLQSGVQYARADATTQTNVVIQTSKWQEVIPATSQVRGNQQLESAVRREQIVEYDYRDVNLNNQFQFTSVPVTAGYMLIKQKFTLELNAGIVTNMYMGNRLSGDDSEIANVTVGPGDQSPYRQFSFSGLAGVEMGYRFLKNFNFIIEPNYRRAINSLTKDNSTFSSSPSGFGVMTGIRYNFK